MFKLSWLTVFLLFTVSMSTHCFAEADKPDPNQTLSIDTQTNGHFSFANDQEPRVKRGDFVLEHSVLMSNEAGERWAVITIKNNSSGRRTIETEHVLALFANGQQKFAKSFSQTFKGQETISLTINFGYHKFPILSLQVGAP